MSKITRETQRERALSDAASLVQLLRRRASQHPSKRAYTFLAEGEEETGTLSYFELDQQARAIGAWLQSVGARGERVLLLYPPGLDYITAFFGCLYAGAVAVTAYPPKNNRNIARLQAIVSDAGAKAALTTASILSTVRAHFEHSPDLERLHWLSTEGISADLAGQWKDPDLKRDDLAFLQYTSGSTAAPKGVMVSHGNLLHNGAMMRETWGLSEQSVVVSWLPLYHDMGLIGSALQSLYSGAHCVLMPPTAFLQSPLRWLRAITLYRGTLSCAPNFAFDLCVRKIPIEERAALDLSSWKVAINGSEPLRNETLERFLEAFGGCGFRPETMNPGYGLAEATLLVSSSKVGSPLVFCDVRKSELEENRIVPASQVDEGSYRFISCGRVCGGQKLIIADPHTGAECLDGQIGEIWLSGASVARGYWNRAKETEETFGARTPGNGKRRFLRTGDLGFIRDGNLYIAGRLKDLIIIRGRNHYPQDIELTAEKSDPALRPGCGAAFTIDEDGEDRLVIVQEVGQNAIASLNVEEVVRKIRESVADQHEIAVDHVVLIKPGAISKTSSGKIQRRATRERYLNGGLEVISGDAIPQPEDSKPAAGIQETKAAAGHGVGKNMEFSLFYFSSVDAEFSSDKYRLFLEGAKFADKHGFTAVWTPERHFHAFGGLYPNPAVLNSALAMLTERVRLRAGSVVLPLHNPIRVAEEWSIVDNLSRGRVDLAFARGWNPNDFVLSPNNFANNNEVMFSEVDTVRRLWRGESVKCVNGVGEGAEVKIFPAPQQREVEVWITCSGGLERFVEAGAKGYNVLTALLFQPIEELGRKIEAYRDARARHGHDPATGHVTLMLHTFVGDDLNQVRAQVRGPFIEYLKSSVNLWSNRFESLQGLSEKEQEELLAYAFERYFHASALFGTPETCLPTIERLAEIGVHEIACLIDFGVAVDTVLTSLPTLDKLRRRFNGISETAEPRETCNPSLQQCDQRGPIVTGPEEIFALKQGKPGAEAAVDHHSLSRWLRSRLVQHVAASLRIEPQRVAIDKSFHSLGVDSLKAVEIVDRLGVEFGVVLSSTLLFASPTIAELTDHLAQEHLPAVVAKFKKDLTLTAGDQVSETVAELTAPLTQERSLAAPAKCGKGLASAAGDQASEDEIAIIGMACRFPQAPDLQSYWELLLQGRSAVREVPPDHWDWRKHFDENQQSENKSYSRWGGFLDQIDQFDPGFFNISPREARLMDPQQRLFLEVAWETIEHAGYPAEKLAHTNVGVFVGCSNNSYYERIAPTLTLADHSAGIGNQKAIIANRVSFHLNLRGPSILIDTMCSSSLVATHLACQSLRQGECSAAIVGGVNVLISPEYFVGMSRLKALSPDGSCKAFDHRANGIALGEGAGAVMLKPLTRAIEDGDTIYAVIKGSAVNHGGQANGMTAPNPQAQARLVRDALDAAKVSSQTITYVEAHGTGTPLGDPIEIDGLTEAFRQDTDQRQFCAIGSVKTNIGHLEPAAGIAGLIKVVLSMQHRQIPPSINFDAPNPIIPFADTPFRVNTELSPWKSEGPRRAGVSAFGMGGANAHLIVEEPSLILPAGQSGPAGNDVERPLHLFALSAKSEAALMALSSSVEKALADNPALHLADVCHTANLSRSSFPYRIVLPARAKAELREALAAYARDGAARGGRFGVVSADPLGELEVAFLFTGQGSQYPDMGRGLYETQPVFRRAVEHCDQLLRPHLDRSLLSVLYPAPGETSPIAETVYAQPAIFALEYALAQLWISWGIKPAAALGHSVGEYAAACVAGVFSLEDGLRMVADRGRLMQSLSDDGKMAAVFCSEAQAVEALAAFQDSISIAAVNGPRSVVISGPVEAVDAAIRRLERDGVTTQTLNVSRAFHSRLMDQILDAFEDSAKTALFSTPRISLISNLTGRPMEPGYVPDARYWRRHARETVRFEAGINTLGGQGRRAFIEIGPMPTLINLGRRCLSNASMLWLPSLKQDQDEWLTMTDSLSKLYVNGVKVDWEGFDRPYSRRRVALPTYPFERRRCWVDVVEQEKQDNPTEARQDITATPARRGESLGILVDFLSNALEVDASEIDIHRPFLDMGADSLVMLDAIQTIEERFGVKLEVRQLFEEYNTLDALSRRIDEQSPLAKAPGVNGQPQSHAVSAPNAAPQSQATAPAGLQIAGAWASATSHASSATESHGGLERLMEQQLSAFSQLMAQQLAVLGNRHPVGNGAGAENGTSLLNGVNRAVKDPREIQSPPVAVSRNGSAAAEEREKGGNAWLPYQPLNPGTLEDLNPRQRKHLGAFIERYVERTRESKRATQFYRSAHADWRASASFRLCTKEIRYPIIGVRSDGSKLWDADGNEYVDYTMGYGVNLFGHGAPFITAALEEQMGKGIHLGPQAELAGEVAALISEITGMERVTFANTGTEAVMAALRLARLATGRNKVVIFAGSYHGTSDGVLVVGRVNNGVHGAAPMVPGIPPGMAEEVIVLNYGSARALEIIRSRASELAAVLVEPVQSRRPDLQPGEFLRELRRVTEEAGVLLIFDEVITGFRILPGGAQAWYGVRADLASYGKIIGGGMPIGAVAGRADIMRGIDGGMWRYGDSSMPAANATLYTGTFCKHPLAMAAARAVLNHIKDQGPELYTQLNQRATRLVEALNEYCEDDQVPIQVVQFGSLFRLSGPLLLQAPDAVDLLFYHLIEKGIYVWEGRNWFMSTVHTDADLEAVVRAFKQSAAEMREGGFLPETGSRPSARGIRANALLGGVDGAGAEQAEPLILPMTETQKQLWFLTQANSEGSESYQQSMAIHLRGPLRLQAMRQAIQQVVDRHEALRTTFDQGEWQRIHRKVEMDLPLVDLYEWAECAEREGQKRAAAVERWLQAEVKRPFDLGKGPLLRAYALKLEAEHHMLIVTAHHLVTDGWSMGVILKELGAIYSAECGGKSAGLPHPAQFREFVEWRNSESVKAGMNEAEIYWLKQLAGSEEVPALPADRPRRLGHSSAGARLYTTLDRSLSANLAALSAREGCTLSMTLLAAYQVLIHQLTSVEESVVIMPAAGQSSTKWARLIGDCANLLPLRMKIAPRSSFSSHLASVKDELLNGYRFLDYPFADLVSNLNPPQDPSRWPFFNIDKLPSAPKFFELEVDFAQIPISGTNFDLSLNFTQLGTELQVVFDYKTDLFDDGTVRGWMSHFMELLGAVVWNPTIPISDLPSPPERPGATEIKETRGASEDSVAAWVAPRTPTEQILAGVWAEMLGVERIGTRDNFFALGGHSVMATRLISRLRDLFHVDLTLRPLFDHPTIAGLAGHLDRMEGATRQAAPPITPALREGALPLSFAQERLWFIERMNPGNIAYNMPGALRIKGPLNVAALQAALSEIVRRHEVLRTVYVDLSGRPAQVIKPPIQVDLPLTDLRDTPEARRGAAAARQAEEEVRKPFDLANGPILRTHLLRLDEEEHVLVITAHHIAADGWSIGVLAGELTALYNAYSLDEPSPLPEPVIQYGDYSIWQREWLRGEVLESQLDYWKRRLDGAPVKTELPVDRFHQARPSFRGAQEPFTLSGALTEALKELSRQEDATLFMTLLAAFQTLLYRYSGQKDVIVGADIANRNRSETEPLIGFFVNLLALRTDLSGDPPFRELLRRVREVTLDAYAHQDVPFGKIVEALRPERGVTRTPFVQALCVLQNAPMPPLKLAGLEVSLFQVDSGTAEFELILDMEETVEGLNCSLKYNTDLFDRETIEAMVERYRRLLESVANRPDQLISAIPLLSDVESGGLAVFDFPEAELTQKDFENLVSKLTSAD